jgi:hypothetical protein
MDGPRCPHDLLIPDDHSRGRDLQEDAGVNGHIAMLKFQKERYLFPIS